MTAKDKMIELAEGIFLTPSDYPDGPKKWSWRNLKPGESFQQLPEEIKELLKELKSDDLKNVRWPPWK
ncbi:hypothetical protein C4577_02255 [Candidatus Parcubacteria bacterium]|nr:MAG: hypothetical protein C4577_02255 [Candidatus Parcubacteria bacterium]